MELDSSRYILLEQKIKDWAANDPGLIAAVAVGSRTRKDPPADAWSDLDVMLFLQNHESYIGHTDWLESIDEIWLSIIGRTAGNDPERLVVFAGGYSVDFVFLPAGAIDWLCEHGMGVEPFVRGYRILVDKDGRLSQLPPAQNQPLQPTPSAGDFVKGVNAFWFSAYRMARALRRGDLWGAHQAQNHLCELLAQLLAVHAQTVRGRTDVWFAGRFMERWADPQQLQAVEKTFWRHDEVEAWCGLLESITLFDQVARDSAAALNIEYPAAMADNMAGLIHALHPA